MMIPPEREVFWVADAWIPYDNYRQCIVKAQTWYFARMKAAATLGIAPEIIECRLATQADLCQRWK